MRFSEKLRLIELKVLGKYVYGEEFWNALRNEFQVIYYVFFTFFSWFLFNYSFCHYVFQKNVILFPKKIVNNLFCLNVKYTIFFPFKHSSNSSLRHTGKMPFQRPPFPTPNLTSKLPKPTPLKFCQTLIYLDTWLESIFIHDNSILPLSDGRLSCNSLTKW